MRPKAAENRIPGIWYLRHAYREMLEWRLIRVSLCVLGAGVLTLTVVSPMGIEESLGPLQRLAFVALCGVCCWPLCHALSAAILYVARSRPPLQILLACLSGALFMAVPLSAVVFTVYGLFQPRHAANLRLPEVYLNTAVLALACGSIVHYVACQRVKLGQAAKAGARPVSSADNAGETAPAAGSVPWSDSRDGFFARLPEMVGRDIVYLTVSGHYINVVTTAGSCLLLMRLADAVAALGDIGMQVHRSYWVAHRHIIGVLRRDGRMALRLTGSQEVPVSRSHMAAVRAAVSAAKEGGAGPR